MKKAAVFIALFLCITMPAFSQETENTKAWAKYDFVPGDKIMFHDDQVSETVGEFPSKWKLLKGSAEIIKFADSNVVGFTKNGSDIEPLMKKAAYLPAVFTIEFDIYFHHKGNEAYYVNFDQIGKLDIRIRNMTLKSFSGEYEIANKPGWHHVAIAFNQGKMKTYLDHNKAMNIPDIGGKPTKFTISSLSFGAVQGYPSVIRNIRVAEGGMDLYKRIVTDGKFITRGILFDVNKSNIQSQSMGVLNEIVKVMNEHPELKFSIEGHTDSDGEETYNNTLSEKRAEAVKKSLIEMGISSDRLTTKGLGETKPVDNNTSPEGKANNRRVEFIKQ
jgi:outer membrane protein OmpA-like peptidoglycan-associated protein